MYYERVFYYNWGLFYLRGILRTQSYTNPQKSPIFVKLAQGTRMYIFSRLPRYVTFEEWY